MSAGNMGGEVKDEGRIAHFQNQRGGFFFPSLWRGDSSCTLQFGMNKERERRMPGGRGASHFPVSWQPGKRHNGRAWLHARGPGGAACLHEVSWLVNRCGDFLFHFHSRKG